MFQILKYPDKKNNYLKIELWYKDHEPNKGYMLNLQKVNYKNNVYSYDLMPTEENTRFIQLDNRKRRSYQAVNRYNRSILIHAEKITNLFELRNYKELDEYVKQNIGENK